MTGSTDPASRDPGSREPGPAQAVPPGLCGECRHARRIETRNGAPRAGQDPRSLADSNLVGERDTHLSL